MKSPDPTAILGVAAVANDTADECSEDDSPHMADIAIAVGNASETLPDTRREHDLLGELDVPNTAYWGVQAAIRYLAGRASTMSRATPDQPSVEQITRGLRDHAAKTDANYATESGWLYRDADRDDRAPR